MIERIDPALFRFCILMDNQFHARILGRFFPQRIHVPEFPGRINMEQRKRRS